MYRFIVLLAVGLFSIAHASPNPTGTPSSILTDGILSECSTQCTGNRKAADVLLTTIDFPSPQSLQPYCDNHQCIDQCAHPKNPDLWYIWHTTKILCTDEDYAKSYECLKEHTKSAMNSRQCEVVGGYEDSDPCKPSVDHVNCVVGRLTDTCGESGGRATRRLAEESLKAAGLDTGVKCDLSVG